jgi:hypothetical protein
MTNTPTRTSAGLIQEVEFIWCDPFRVPCPEPLRVVRTTLAQKPGLFKKPGWRFSLVGETFRK